MHLTSVCMSWNNHRSAPLFSSSWPLATFSGSNMILTFVHKIKSKSTNVCMCLLQDDKQGTPTVTQPRLPRYVKKQCLLTAWVNWGMYIIEVANHWAPFLSCGLISFPVESTLVQVLLFLNVPVVGITFAVNVLYT